MEQFTKCCGYSSPTSSPGLAFSVFASLRAVVGVALVLVVSKRATVARLMPESLVQWGVGAPFLLPAY